MITMNDFVRQVGRLHDELQAAIQRVLASGWFILGEEVKAFEREFAAFVRTRHAVGVGNGMDAIQLALAAVGVGDGDEVITTPFSAFATTLAVLKLGARPVFVDVDPRTYGVDLARVEGAITPRTRALLPVHLYGQPLDLDALSSLTRSRSLKLVNDAAQAHGARWRGKDIAEYGNATAYSFYPTKNLGCLGDGGAVATDDDDVAAQVRRMRDYGQERRYVHVDARGLNSRLDELQAAILRVKLTYLAADNRRRAAIATHYRDGLSGLPLTLPAEIDGAEPVHHLFVVRTPRRDALMTFLRERDVQTLVHYPITIPSQPAMSTLGHRIADFPGAERCAAEVLSLPIHAELTDGEVEKVVAATRAFFA